MKKYFIGICLLFSVHTVFSQTTFPAAEAARHVGEKATICDKVFGGRFLESANGQPTLVNMGAAFPASPFTFVIFGDDRKKFTYKPEEFLVDKQVCVTGEIKTYRDKPQIIVSDTTQVMIKQ